MAPFVDDSDSSRSFVACGRRPGAGSAGGERRRPAPQKKAPHIVDGGSGRPFVAYGRRSGAGGAGGERRRPAPQKKASSIVDGGSGRPFVAYGRRSGAGGAGEEYGGAPPRRTKAPFTWAAKTSIAMRPYNSIPLGVRRDDTPGTSLGIASLPLHRYDVHAFAAVSRTSWRSSGAFTPQGVPSPP